MKLVRKGALRSGISISTALAAMLLAACAATSPAPIGHDRIAEIINSPDRSAADRNNDIRRKPADLLAFIGIKPGMVALDLSAAGGYTSELLARSVGPGGRVYAQNPPRDPANPPRQPSAPEGNASGSAVTPAASPVPRQTVGERAKNPAVAHLVAVTRRFEDPVPPEIMAGTLDLATLMFNYHDLGHLGVDRGQMNRAVFTALKAGGVYVIADHSGRSGTGISEAGTLHRIEEAFLLKEVEATGFRLAEQGNFLRNPNDPRDKNTPEPLQPKDEFVLKFIKP